MKGHRHLTIVIKLGMQGMGSHRPQRLMYILYRLELNSPREDT